MKTKSKISWLCTSCGHTQAKWSGNCPFCREWNTIVEFKEAATEDFHSDMQYPSSNPTLLKDIVVEDTERLQTNLQEFDRLMGGGVAKGSFTLIAGDPGVGKSTLMLEIAKQFSKNNKTVLYVSGEESLYQTSLRAKRMNINADQVYIYAETDFSKIAAAVNEIQPDLFIVDSIQIVYKPTNASIPGSVSQVREVALDLVKIAKKLGVTIFAIGHVTKSGDLAGPRILEHMVDTVLEFEGDLEHGHRILRSRKNRFGSTDEVAVFEMHTIGLVEVSSPSLLFLKERQKKVEGSVVTAITQGSRAILVEVQALIAPTNYPSPTRRSTGIDANRLLLLLAVLEKRVGVQIGFQDVFVSVAGGLTAKDPAMDLAILFAMVSSHTSKPVPPDIAMVGEVGLSGELRSVYRIEQRIKEIANMGFKGCVLPSSHAKVKTEGIKLYFFDQAHDAIGSFLQK